MRRRDHRNVSRPSRSSDISLTVRRITGLDAVIATPYTVLGFTVTDIEATVDQLPD